jgi:hypothetical protein
MDKVIVWTDKLRDTSLHPVTDLRYEGVYTGMATVAGKYRTDSGEGPLFRAKTAMD